MNVSKPAKKEVPISVCLCKFSQGLVVLSNGLKTPRATPAAGDSLRSLAPEFRKSLLVADTGSELFLCHLCSETGPCPERKECVGRAGGVFTLCPAPLLAPDLSRERQDRTHLLLASASLLLCREELLTLGGTQAPVPWN